MGAYLWPGVCGRCCSPILSDCPLTARLLTTRRGKKGGEAREVGISDILRVWRQREDESKRGAEGVEVQ